MIRWRIGIEGQDGQPQFFEDDRLLTKADALDALKHWPSKRTRPVLVPYLCEPAEQADAEHFAGISAAPEA